MFTDGEASALRKVAKVMRSCAADLPGDSPIGAQLADEATRLLLLLGPPDHRSHLELVAELPPL